MFVNHSLTGKSEACSVLALKFTNETWRLGNLLMMTDAHGLDMCLALAGGQIKSLTSVSTWWAGDRTSGGNPKESLTLGIGIFLGMLGLLGQHAGKTPCLSIGF